MPPSEFGQRYTEIREWPDGNCGADGWAITPSGTRGVLNDAISIYFLDATLGCRTGHPRSRSTLRDAPVILAASLGLWAANLAGSLVSGCGLAAIGSVLLHTDRVAGTLMPIAE